MTVVSLVERYVQVSVGRTCLLAAAALTALFSLFEFVEQLAFVGQGRYRLADAAVYVLLTSPYRLLQVAPVSVLLGCLLALGGLGRHAELVASGSLGVSERRIVGSVVKLAVPIVLVLFALSELVVPRAQRLAQERRASALSSLTAVRGEDSFWAEDGGRFLNVQRFDAGNVPRDIDIFDFDGHGALTSFIHADRADIRTDGHWLLFGVLQKQVEAFRIRSAHLASLSWPSFISAAQTELLILPPSSMPPVALYRYVRELRRRHQPAARYEEEFWRKLSVPVSIVAMIVIAAPFVFGAPRSRSAGAQLAIGVGIGVVFSLVEQISARLDLVLDLDPALLTLAPSLMLMTLASYLFLALQR